VAAVVLTLLRPDPIPAPIHLAAQTATQALQGGSPAAAVEPLETLDALLPAQPGIRRLLIQTALAGGNADLALSTLQSSGSLDLSSADLACLRVQVDLRLGREQDALAALQSTDRICPEASAAGIELARSLLLAGKRDQAASWVGQLTLKGNLDPAGLLRAGVIQVVLDPNGASPALRAADERMPGGSALAQDLLRDLRETPPGADPATSFARIGQTLARHGQWPEASVAFEAADRSRPGDANVLTYLGLSRDNAGGDGLTALQEAVRLEPQSSLAHASLAQHDRLHGQFEAARAELELAATLDPGNPAIAAELGATYAELGQLPSAAAAYRQATGLAPNDPGFWRLLAQFSLDHESDVELTGLPAARNALALSPSDPATCDLLGYAYFLLGDLVMADRFLLRSVQMDPLAATTQFHLGLLRLGQGQPQRARAALGLAAELDPTGPVGVRAARSLQSISP
jgi:tetratricopeptide (TPR) repeat protein